MRELSQTPNEIKDKITKAEEKVTHFKDELKWAEKQLQMLLNIK